MLLFQVGAIEFVDLYFDRYETVHQPNSWSIVSFSRGKLNLRRRNKVMDVVDGSCNYWGDGVQVKAQG